MGIFDRMLKHDESLFKNELVLDYEYLPHILKFREGQQEHIATIIKPLFQNRMGANLIITGKPGIGKTAACRHVLREMEKYSDKISGIYVNCWKNDTVHKIVLEICKQLGYKWVQNKNSNELINEIAKILNKKTAVIILDEADKLKEEQIIYYLLEEIYKKCLIMISNEKDFLSYLDQRTRSRLIPEILEFEAYSIKETFEILKERADVAFYPTVCQDEHIENIAEKAFEVGDLRTGLFLLKECGNAAENRSSRKIEISDIEKAIGKLSSFRESKTMLDEEERAVLNMIKKNNGLASSFYCDLYKKEFNKSDRTFRRKVASLKTSKLIISKDGKDVSGKIIPLLFVKEN
jgi:archaeal cell division control protein 6